MTSNTSDSVDISGSATLGGTFAPAGTFTARHVYTVVDSALEYARNFATTNGGTFVMSGTNLGASAS